METSAVPPPDASALGISFDGRAWHYRAYTYNRLADAVGYARLDRARPGFREDASPHRWPQWGEPTAQDRGQMAACGIGYEHGRYCYGPYRYDLLAAALEYARHAPGLAAGGPAATQAAAQ